MTNFSWSNFWWSMIMDYLLFVVIFRVVAISRSQCSLHHSVRLFHVICCFIGMSLQPEMEMVARGLEKHLKVDQRESLMNSLLQVCGDETRRSVAEALGLVCLVYYSPSLSRRSGICCSLLLCFYWVTFQSEVASPVNFACSCAFWKNFALQLCKIDLNRQCGEDRILSSVLYTVLLPFLFVLFKLKSHNRSLLNVS